MADKKTDPETAVRQKIAELPDFADVGARLHRIITDAAPDLAPRLWYGMPGYARSKSSPVLCFFRDDGTGYLSLGLTEKAELQPADGETDKLIPSAWFLTELDDPTEARIAEIVRRATTTPTD